MLQITFAKGFPIHVRHFVRDDDTLVYLDMIGSPDKVRASWAGLKDGGRRHWVLSEPLQLQKQEHVVLRQTLPCSWGQTVMIHNQASYEQMEIGITPFFYLIDWNRSSSGEGRGFICANCHHYLNSYECTHARCNQKRQPANFYPMLTKALPFPILPSWTNYLWELGWDEDLITVARGASYQSIAFKVAATPSKWKAIISQGLHDQTITF